eukprot:PhF_6_TR545/c0_g1_i3/m.482
MSSRKPVANSLSRRNPCLQHVRSSDRVFSPMPMCPGGGLNTSQMILAWRSMLTKTLFQKPVFACSGHCRSSSVSTFVGLFLNNIDVCRLVITSVKLGWCPWPGQQCTDR